MPANSDLKDLPESPDAMEMTERTEKPDWTERPDMMLLHKLKARPVSEIALQDRPDQLDRQETRDQRDTPASKESPDLQESLDPEARLVNRDLKALKVCPDAQETRERQENTFPESHRQARQEDKEKWDLPDSQVHQAPREKPASQAQRDHRETKETQDRMESLDSQDRWAHPEVLAPWAAATTARSREPRPATRRPLREARSY